MPENARCLPITRSFPPKSFGKTRGYRAIWPAGLLDTGYLIARLALDVSLHGRGRSAQLLLDALGGVVRAAEISGGRLIVVDAIDDAAQQFYEHFGFIPVNNRPGRLVMKVSTVEAARRQP